MSESRTQSQTRAGLRFLIGAALLSLAKEGTFSDERQALQTLLFELDKAQASELDVLRRRLDRLIHGIALRRAVRGGA